MIEFKEEAQGQSVASIKVIGVGGAGGNTVNSIVGSGYHGIESIVANTDAQVLGLSKASHTIHIGVKSTKGLGTGANPELGKRAAEEDLDKIMEAIGDADIVFLTAGMGGGTGSGALPVVAHALRERGILSIAVVTKPFVFEGKRRAAVADKAIEALRKEVDTLIVIPNQKLLAVVDQNVSMIDAFSMINEILSKSVKGISDIITKPGHINVDFADVRTIMKDMGLAVLGTGCATGEGRASQAALNAITSPLLESMSIKGARGVLLNITGGKNLGLHEISQAASVIYDQVDEDATIILGSVIDESLTDQVTVTIIATGFHHQEPVLVAKTIEQKNSIAPELPKIIASILDQSENSVNQSKGSCDAQAGDEKNVHEMQNEVVEEHVNAFADVQAATQISQETSESIASLSSNPEVSKASVVEQPEPVDMHDLDVPAFMRKDMRLEQ
jgi:cell division protein FtsZ